MRLFIAALACLPLILSSCCVNWGSTKDRQSIAYGEHLDSHFNVDLGFGEQAVNFNSKMSKSTNVNRNYNCNCTGDITTQLNIYAENITEAVIFCKQRGEDVSTSLALTGSCSYWAEGTSCFVAPNDYWTDLHVTRPDTLVECYLYEIIEKRKFNFAYFGFDQYVSDSTTFFYAPLYSVYGLADSVQQRLQKPFLKEGFHYVGGNIDKFIINID